MQKLFPFTVGITIGVTIYGVGIGLFTILAGCNQDRPDYVFDGEYISVENIRVADDDETVVSHEWYETAGKAVRLAEEHKWQDPQPVLHKVKIVSVQQNYHTGHHTTILEFEDGTRKKLEGEWGKEGDEFMWKEEKVETYRKDGESYH